MSHYNTTRCDICNEEMLHHYWNDYSFCRTCKQKYHNLTNETLCGVELTGDEFKAIKVLLKLNS